MIDIIIPTYKVPIYLTKCLESIETSPDIRITVVDDMSPNGEAIKQVTDRFGAQYFRLEYQTDLYRRCPAIYHGIANTTQEIIGVIDEDMTLSVGYIDKVKILLTTYRNLIVWGKCIFIDLNDDSVYSPRIHPDVRWSTVNNVRPQWSGLCCDGVFFIRRDFLSQIGNMLQNPGYGEDGEDLCKRVSRNGGIIGIFEDLEYYHIAHDGNKIPRQSEETTIRISDYSYNRLERIYEI